MRIMFRSTREATFRYVAAILAVLSASLLLAIPAIGQVPNNPAILISLAIAFASWQGGTGPGLTATALIALLTLPGSFDGRLIARHALFVSAGGMISLLIGSLHSARVRAESATRQARDHQDRLRLLIDSVQDHALFSTDAHGRVASWNVGAERVLGYKEREILGRNVSLFLE
jgi:PAS domain-containing protein